MKKKNVLEKKKLKSLAIATYANLLLGYCILKLLEVSQGIQTFEGLRWLRVAILIILIALIVYMNIRKIYAMKMNNTGSLMGYAIFNLSIPVISIFCVAWVAHIWM